MAERVHIPKTPPPPGSDGDRFYYPMNHLSGTQYSSGAEGAPADCSSSHGTPYGSPDLSWSTDQGARSGYDWYSPINQYSSHQYHAPYIRQDSDGPVTRHRGPTGRKGSPSSRQTTSSPASNRSRKAKSAKAAKPSNVNLDVPLSVSTKDSKVPLKDMESFVHRSVEERVKEKDKKNGYIVRPMNAFMLYRSAYADRAKSLFAQNNHQIVSKATGQSWRMESKEVQEHYKMLAEIERDNHAKAWPNYKFTPSKTGSATRKQKGSEFGSGDEGTEADVSDHEWTPSGTRKARPARASNRRQLRDKDVGSPYPQQRRPTYLPPHPSLNASHYGVSNPGRPIPLPMEELNSLNHGPHYYHQSTRYQPGHRGTEDVQFEQMGYGPAALMSAPNFPPAGLGAHHEDPFGNYASNQGPGYYGHVDPKLDDFGPVTPHGMFTEDGFDAYHGDLLMQQTHHRDGESLPAGEPSFAEMLANEEGFQRWIESENQQ